MTDITPRIDANGVPLCSEECPSRRCTTWTDGEPVMHCNAQGNDVHLDVLREDEDEPCKPAISRMAKLSERRAGRLREMVSYFYEQGHDAEFLLGIYREYDLGEPPANICPLSPELEESNGNAD